MLIDFSKQCTDAMLEGLSNITTQTCYLLCGHKKLNKLDNSKKFSIFKNSRGPGLDLYAHNLGENNSTDLG